MLSSVILKQPTITEEQLKLFIKELEECEIYISDVMARLLLLRQIDTPEKVDEFLNPDMKRLYDPYLMKGMNEAIDLIKFHMQKGHKITVYGDYDVDGVTSTTILYKTLNACGADVSYYIPDRLQEGYGINSNAIEMLIHGGTKLIISVDTGITAVDPVSIAKGLGADIIITDHHECQEELPSADCILNPKQEDCPYPFKGLAGVGVTYKLVQALCKVFELDREFELDLLEIVAVGTIADLVPLIGENRTMVYHAFLRMENIKNIGLKALFDVAGIEVQKRSAGVIGFQIGPRLNAAGRLGDAKRGVELFLNTDSMAAIEIAETLNVENQKRRDMEEKIFAEADALIKQRFADEIPDILVVAHDGWHHGVIGIVASRITEKYYRPTILLAIEDGIASGSARSVEGFSIFDALLSTKQVFTKFGGHEMAAGMSLPEDRVEELFVNLNQYAKRTMTHETLIPKVKIEDVLAAENIDVDFIDALAQFEPFGMGNEEPRFLIQGIVHSKELMGKDKNHFKLRLTTERTKKPIDMISFFNAHYDEELMDNMPIGVIGTLQVNEWKSFRNPQVFIKEIIYDEAVERTLLSSHRILHALLEHSEEKRWKQWLESFDEIDPEHCLIDRGFCVHIYKNIKKLVSNNITVIDLANLLSLSSDYEIDSPKAGEDNANTTRFIHISEYVKIMIAFGIFSELGLLTMQLLPHGAIEFALNSSKKVELTQSTLYNEMCCQND